MNIEERFKRASDPLAISVLLLGIAAIAFAIAVVVRCYMPCPFWDEWVVVEAIAKGNGPTSWAWLWSQQNEHRLAVPRLMVWLDLYGFGGKNISLFVEIMVVQCFHWLAICFVVERFTRLPGFLKRSIQGLFAFCLFHPNQLENFTWAFQIGFVLPFALGTIALIIIAFVAHCESLPPPGDHNCWFAALHCWSESVRRSSHRSRSACNRLSETSISWSDCDLRSYFCCE